MAIIRVLFLYFFNILEKCKKYFTLNISNSMHILDISEILEQVFTGGRYQKSHARYQALFAAHVLMHKYGFFTAREIKIFLHHFRALEGTVKNCAQTFFEKCYNEQFHKKCILLKSQYNILLNLRLLKNAFDLNNSF